jgi:ribosomal-protein-alanine N-acetyltransferase
MDDRARARDAPSVRLLRAGRTRAAEIAALHRLLFDPSWDEAAVAALLDQPASLAFVAEDENTGPLAGFVLALVAADQADLLSIAVRPSHQRCGLASRLITELASALKALTVRKLYLEVAADNTAALACYRALGFAEAGMRKAYYARGAYAPADAVLLVRDL